MSIDLGLGSAAVERLAAQLSVALGEDAVAVSDALREQHGGGETYHPVVPPDIVVFPRSTDDVVGIVQLCSEHGAAIVPTAQARLSKATSRRPGVACRST